MIERNRSPASTPDMLDAAGVASNLRRWVPLGASIAQNWARERRILEVREDGAAAYPACQFDEAGLPIPEMRRIILALAPRFSAREMLDWLHTPCLALDGRTPRSLLHDDPEAVCTAAAGAVPVGGSNAQEPRRRRAAPAKVSAKASSLPHRSRSVR